MAKRRPRNTSHAEGEHGPKTEAHIAKQLRSSPPEPPLETRLAEQRSKAAFSGKRRLVEDRQQHDESEKNSEHRRLFEESRRGNNDGPSDNSGNLHGVLGSREHRADYKERRPDGLPSKGRP
jgi:hypothetical protein